MAGKPDPTSPSSAVGLAEREAAPKSSPRRRRKWLWRLTGLFMLLLLVAVLWAGWYVYYRGFTRKWREQLAAELRSRGLDFNARRLTLNPFEGLVVEDAHLYLLDEHRTLLLFISRAAVDINYINLILKKPFLNSLDVRGARLALPVDMSDPEGPKFRLRKFQAKLSFQPNEVRLTQAEGDCYGVQLSLSGTLLHPEKFSPSGPPDSPEELARRRGLARAILEEIQKIKPERGPPRLEIRFNGDLAKISELRASAELTGEALQRGSCRFERVHARLDYEAGAFHLRRAEFTDGRGALTAEGDFNPATGDARFQLQSSADLPRWAKEFFNHPALANFGFLDAPRLQINGQARLNDPPVPAKAALPPADGSAADAKDAPPPALQLTGKLSLGRFSFRGIPFSAAETEFSWRDGSWYLRGLRLNRPGAQQGIEADLLSEPGRCRIRFNGAMDPSAFADLLPERGRAMLSEWRFQDAPKVELTAVGAAFDNPASLRVNGKITLGRTRFRGVALNRLQSDFTFADRALTYRRLTIERDEGSATGEEFVYDFAKHEVRMQNIRANLDPAQVTVWINPDVAKAVAPFRFRKAPNTVTNGVVQFDGGRNSRLTVDVNAPAGMEYTFIKKPLNFRALTGQVLFTDDRLRLNDMKAQIFNGNIEGKLDLSLVRGAPDYSATLELQNLDFAKLTKLYFNYDDSKGLMDASYRFSGRGDDPRTMRGAGSLKIDQGNVFAIPFMGPLSTVLSNVMPGLGFDVAHEGTVDFLTSSGKIYTGNLTVKGVGFSMLGAGWIGYVEDAMNFRVRINARGIPGAVLYPVSKLLEYSSHGPVGKPVWSPRILKRAPPSVEEEDEPPLAKPVSPAALKLKESP
jgi:hypothetical protein